MCTYVCVSMCVCVCVCDPCVLLYFCVCVCVCVWMYVCVRVFMNSTAHTVDLWSVKGELIAYNSGAIPLRMERATEFPLVHLHLFCRH